MEKKSIPYSERKFDKTKKINYDVQYAKEHFYRPSVVLPKEYKNTIQKAAAESGQTLSEFIREAIDDKLKSK